MRRLLQLSLLLGLLSCETKEESYWVYVSSDDVSDGQGISILDWNPASGQLNLKGQSTAVANSSYMAINEATGFLYSINGNSVQSFKIDKESGELSLVNESRNTGIDPCHISISNDQSAAFVGYYSSGSLSAFPIKPDGSIDSHVAGYTHRGSSINPERQERAHVHMVYPVPNSDLILVPDLGIDKVLAYKWLNKSDLIPVDEEYIAQIEPGGGPRHMVVHPSLKFAFVLHELTGKVSSFKFDPANGFGELIETVSTLPEDFTEFNKSADIHLGADGKYLYASNRGHNSIAVIEVDQNDGSMETKDIQSCGGDWPRAFEVDPSGKFMLVANKRSNSISIMKIDQETGLFEKVGEVETALAPQCIKFIRK